MRLHTQAYIVLMIAHSKRQPKCRVDLISRAGYLKHKFRYTREVIRGWYIGRKLHPLIYKYGERWWLRSIRRVCINCSKLRHVNLLSSYINHKTTGSGPVDDLAQPRLTIKSCKLLQTHCGPRVRIPTVLGTRTRVRPVLTYLPDLLVRASLLIQSLAYLLIPPLRIPYPPHFSAPRISPVNITCSRHSLFLKWLVQRKSRDIVEHRNNKTAEAFFTVLRQRAAPCNFILFP